MTIKDSERERYDMAFSGHGKGYVITQRDGVFCERPMTPGELMAREPAMKIAEQIHKFAFYAAFAYINCWEIIAPVLSDMTADRDRWKAIAEGERESRWKTDAALRQKEGGMQVLFDRLHKAGIDTSDLIP